MFVHIRIVNNYRDESHLKRPWCIILVLRGICEARCLRRTCELIFSVRNRNRFQTKLKRKISCLNCFKLFHTRVWVITLQPSFDMKKITFSRWLFAGLERTKTIFASVCVNSVFSRSLIGEEASEIKDTFLLCFQGYPSCTGLQKKIDARLCNDLSNWVLTK